MIKEGIEKIEALVKTAEEKKLLEVDGRKYSFRDLVPVKEPAASAKEVYTLTAIMNYLTENTDALKLDDLIVHVEGPQVVWVESKLFGPFRQREYFLKANARIRSFKYGQYIPVEEFIISLQAFFKETETTKSILRIVGNLASSAVKTVTDDGMTQEVMVKAGVASIAEDPKKVPNPVSLSPFRTFLEVEQPESKFVLRIKADKDREPMVALFEADGGMWELAAISNVGNWLRNSLPAVTVLA